MEKTKQANLTQNQTEQIAVIYCRVSGTKQVRDGDGLASQATRCREYARYRGYVVAQVFQDDMTGGAVHRPAMDQMLAFLRKHRRQTPVVIIDDISRLARGLEAHLHLRSALAKAGGRLESPSIEFGEDSDSRLHENMLASVAQHQREKNGEQTLNRMMARMMNGYWVFQAPMGYRYERVAGHNKMLVRDEPIASLIQEALEGFAYGRFATQAEVKRFLETHPDFPARRQTFLHPQRVTDLLTRPIYAGYITHENWNLHLIKAKHEPLIDYALYQKIQERRAAKSTGPRRSDINDDFPLRGFVTCADCNELLTAAWSKGRSKHYAYYACDTRGCPSNRKSIRRDDIEGDFEALLKRIVPTSTVVEMATAMFKKAWNMQQASDKQRKKSLKQDLSAVERDLTKTLDRLIETDEPTLIRAYERKIKALEQRRAETEAALASSSASTGTFEANYRTAMTFLANPWKLWASGNLKAKHAVLKLVFATKLPYARKQGYRTAKTTCVFNALGGLGDAKSMMVPPHGLEPRTY